MKLFAFSLFVILSFFLTSCAGSVDSGDTGGGEQSYAITKEDAEKVVKKAMFAEALGVTINTSESGIVVGEGYNRSIIDTHYFTLTATPLANIKEYKFSMRHRGTLFNGPQTAKQIFSQACFHAKQLSK